MSLYDTLLEKLDGRQYSNYFSCYCIFDQHQSPALLCYDDGMFVCLSCGKKGSLDYLAKKLSISSHSLTRSHSTSSPVVLPQWRKWEQEYGDLEGIAKFAHKSLKAFPQFQNYFKKRKIDEFINMGKFGYLSGWAIFPITNSKNKIINLVVRAIGNKGSTRYVICPNGEESLYSPDWNLVEKSDTVFVPFGLIDVWSFYSLGMASLTGITGKSISISALKSLRKKIVIIPDVGEEEDAHIMANKLGWRGSVKILRYPSGCKDTNDVRMKFDNSTLQDILL